MGRPASSGASTTVPPAASAPVSAPVSAPASAQSVDPRRLASGLSTIVVAGSLAACGSLPRIVPDMARQAPTPRVQSAGGPLSAERSREIIARLARADAPPTVLEQHIALEAALDGSPLVAGNKVTLLQDGPSTYQAMFAAIRSARDHINMETYILEDDETGARFAQALMDKQRQGVQVNLITDAVGTLGTAPEFFERLKNAGIQLVVYNPINPLEASAGWDVNQRDHRKLLIVDGRTAFLGGINISSVYSGGSLSRSRPAPVRPADDGARKSKHDGTPWRDTDLQLDGPIVAQLQKLFIETWNAQKGPELAQRRYFPKLSEQGPEVVHAIAGSPDEPYSLIYATLISAIQSAQKEVLLMNAYFVPDPQTLKALTDAATRGVNVTLILPSVSDSSLVLAAGRSYYAALLRSGVRIYERQSALLHAKTAVIDGVWSTVGSTNLDWRSFLHNRELNAVVLGSEFGERMRDAFQRDLSASTQVTLEQWESRPISDRIKESFARLWQYWL